MNQGESISFFTCGDYELCRPCNNTYKPCHSKQEDFKKEYDDNQREKQTRELEEAELSLKEFSELMDYYDRGY